MRKTALALLSTALLVSCAPESRSRPSDEDRQIINNLTWSEHPVFLPKQQNLCNIRFFMTFQLDLNLRLLLEGSHVTAKKNFDHMFDGVTLRNPNRNIVSDTVYGYEEDQTAGRIISPGKSLTICPGEEVEADTIESAGLNVNYYINKTAEKIHAVMPEIGIAPVVIRVLPALEQRLEGKIGYSTDNATYDPKGLTINFLPDSEEAKNAGMINLWEVPMVPAHEYGHHVLRTLFPKILSATSSSTACFGGAIDNADSTYASPTKKVFDGLNEGFADLIAAYTLPTEAERSVSGLHGLEYARDVSWAYFPVDKNPYGVRKAFTSEVLQAFLGYQGVLTALGPNYADGHVIGAIFAHGADEFMDRLNLTRDQRLKSMLDWGLAMKQNQDSLLSLSGEALLKKSLLIFYKTTLTKNQKTLTTWSCSSIQDTYPDLATIMAECRSLL